MRTAPKVASDAEPARLFDETTVGACEHMVEEERAANAKLERLFDRAVESSPAASRRLLSLARWRTGSPIPGVRGLRTRGVGIGRFAWTSTWTARSSAGCSRRACSARTAARSTSASATAGSSASAAAAVDRVNHGRLGPKGLYGWQANNAADRLLHPLVRRDGELREASWDEAMDLVVERSRELLATKGSGALGFYTSGQLFLEDYYTLALVARGGIGTNHLDGNTRLCTATAGQSLKETFGCDGQPAGVHDIEYCDTILHVGINTAETQTVLWMHELDRLRGPDPPRSIVIDPRETESAREAEVHLAIKPGTNLAVLNGLAQQLIENDRIDREFVELHTIGFDALEKTVSAYTPERVAEICGVAADDVRRAAEILGEAERLLTFVLQGVYQSHQATASACAANNINLLRGMIGKPGAGILQMNGQPTAQNTRETGCNGDLPGFRNWQNEAHVAELARALERRAAADPALGPADARDGDLPLRRAGLDRVPLGDRDEPRRLAARAAPDPLDPLAGGALPRRLGRLPERDGAARRRRPAGRALGREDRDVHEHRPHRAPLRAGGRAAGRGAAATWRSSSTTPGGSTCATRTGSRS